MDSHLAALGIPPLSQRTPTSFLTYYLLPALVLILSLTLPPGRYHLYTTLPLLLCVSYLALCTTTGDLWTDHIIGGAWFPNLLVYLDRVVWTDEKEMRWLGRPAYMDLSGNRNAEAAIVKKYEPDDLKSWGGRFKRAMRLNGSVRGVGWSWEQRGLPVGVKPGYPKWPFVLENLAWGLAKFAVKYLLEKYFTCRYYPSAMPGSGDAGLVLRVALGWAHVLWLNVWLDGMYRLAAAFSVAVGHNEPWEYTPLFGDVTAGYTVRRFWGQSWHQLSRRTMQKPTAHLNSFLRIPKSSPLSRYTALYVTFLLSGYAHHASSYASTRRGQYDMSFFLAQAVAITFEDGVIRLWRLMFPGDVEVVGKDGRREGVQGRGKGPGMAEIRNWEKAVGYVWTFAWLMGK